MAKATTFPVSVSKINFDHFRHEPEDTHKVLKILN